MNIDDLGTVQQLVGLLRIRTQARTELANPIAKLSVRTVGGSYPLEFYADNSPPEEMVLLETVRIKIQTELLNQLEIEIASLEDKLTKLGVEV